MLSTAPILYEVNSRVLLRELSERAGRELSLSEIPDSEMENWKGLGFTHIWLMGVWQVGPEARRIAFEQWSEKWRAEIPSSEENVQGSPFAIQEYSVDSHLGQALDLLLLKERFARFDLRLILDFVPNHLGIDSTEPRRYPARFVQYDSPVEGTFACDTKFGVRYFAHGRDPYFPPWRDTVQVDYRVAETQDTMSSIAQTLSMFGDGLRCDMTMLVLPEIFCETWKEFPSVGKHLTDQNFWRTTIPKIRLLQPNAELIAEAYWDREAELQDAGFDYTYNKRVTDYIVRGQETELANYLRSCTPSFLSRCVHFLENHDEARAAHVLSFRRHKAAAALILFLPGMALLHDGQLEGRKIFAPIQMNTRAPESANPEIRGFYRELLQLLPRTQIRRGAPTLLTIPGAENLIAIEWVAGEGQAEVAFVNLTQETAVFMDSGASTWRRIYSTDAWPEIGADGAVRIPPETAHIFRVR